MKPIPYGHQSISEAEIEAVVAALRSDFLTQGPAVERFEQAFGAAVGAPCAVACSSGTAALHLAALAAGLGPGDRVLVPPVTFVATANAARYVGAEVGFADVEGEHATLSVATAETALVEARRAGRPFKAVVTVDLAGHPCDQAGFGRLKDAYGLVWIEDACHALGATWTALSRGAKPAFGAAPGDGKGEALPPSDRPDAGGQPWKVGEWPVPDLTVFSFHPVKHITTGEGGMVTTHLPRLAERVRSLRSHGITRRPGEFVFPEEGRDRDGQPNPWYYEAQALGFNYRLSDLQCALGLAQLARLPGFLARRREIMARYRRELAGLPGFRLLGEGPGVGHAWHLALARVDFAGRDTTRGRVMRQLLERGVATQVHYVPLPMMPLYAGTAAMADLPEALAYYRETLTLPVFPAMTDEEVARVVAAVREVLG
ncbi:MAG: aminotransferase class I/II-fold pyridoxal phosphate-dependent enzyme [Candidatus Riflebacteria bacterium]|nr:aminotransferase class I/II-fold pyridoxal phosphate-dependent enzyme [Candidatus Riflebacteria bacterium]